MRGEPEVFARLLDALGRHGHLPSCAPRSGRAARPCRCSTAGWARCRRRTTPRFAFPASSKVFAALADLEVPRIHFGVGTGELLGLMASAGADVVGVDWRVPLDEARRRVGPGPALQGNLDPTVCLAPWPVVEEEARRRGAARRLGPHLQSRPRRAARDRPDHLERLVALVHSLSPEDPAYATTQPLATTPPPKWHQHRRVRRECGGCPRRRARHGARDTAQPRRPRGLLHQDPAGQPSHRRPLEPPRAPLPGHRRDLPAK